MIIFACCESSTELTSTELSAGELRQMKEKILAGEFKISSKRGRSKGWNIFQNIETTTGAEISGYLACRKCVIIYKHNKKKNNV